MIDIGTRGTLTVGTRGADGPGEVMVEADGCSEAYIAYSSEPIERGAVVVVYDTHAGRRVDVEKV